MFRLRLSLQRITLQRLGNRSLALKNVSSQHSGVSLLTQQGTSAWVRCISISFSTQVTSELSWAPVYSTALQNLYIVTATKRFILMPTPSLCRACLPTIQPSLFLPCLTETIPHASLLPRAFQLDPILNAGGKFRLDIRKKFFAVRVVIL